MTILVNFYSQNAVYISQKKKNYGGFKNHTLKLTKSLQFQNLESAIREKKENLLCNLAHSHDEFLTVTHAIDALYKCKRK